MESISGLFKNIGHFFATAVSKFLAVEPKVEAVAAKVEAAAPQVEAVEAVIPTYGPLAVDITKAGEMALGAVVGVLHALGNAGQAKLLDAGLDQTAISTALDVYHKLPGQVKAMVTPAAATTTA
jgi:hypothetical protein